jgi:hypothetical protein
MVSPEERVRRRLRDEVCKVCLYRTADGGCDLVPDIDCPILTRVDDIVDIVRSVKADRMDPYVDRLREVICADCRMQNAEGQCDMRDANDCVLDDYFGMIVEIVEEELST